MKLKKTKGFFITGTDTGVGKTTITKLLISEFIAQGYKTLGCKPIACGGIKIDGIIQNEDVHAFQKINSLDLALDEINPIYLEQPVSPNIAAHITKTEICLATLISQLQKLYQYSLDYIFFESVGGWKVPINKSETTINIATELGLPVILIVGIRVGCLNHSLLTFDAISKEKIPTAGWIANIIDDNTPLIQEHIESLKHWINAPYLGMLPYQSSRAVQTHSIAIENLLSL